MIRWRFIFVVLFGSVSSLLAAEQFPAKPKSSDRPALTLPLQEQLSDTFRERILVLNYGTVHRGLIEKTMTGYVLTKPQGKLVFATDQVRLLSDDLPTAYREQSRACPDQAFARIELGRWCFTNNLYDEARKEFRKALSLEPDSVIAKNLLQNVDDKLLATRDLPRVRVVEDGSFSLLGDSKSLATVEPLGGLSRIAAQEFSSRAQPLLVNRCATAGCHGMGAKQEMQLHRIKIGQRAPRAHAEHNLSMLLDRIDRERPLSSPLLMKLRGEARANGLRTSHGSLTPEQMQTLRRWIVSLSNKPTEVLPVAAESSETTKESVEQESTAGKPTKSPAEPDIPEQSEPPIPKTIP